MWIRFEKVDGVEGRCGGWWLVGVGSGWGDALIASILLMMLSGSVVIFVSFAEAASSLKVGEIGTVDC